VRDGSVLLLCLGRPELLELRPGIDVGTLVARRAARGAQVFARWWDRDSPGNRAIGLAGRLARADAARVNAAKLAFCERTMAAVRDRDPVVTAADLDEDVGEIEYSIDQYYLDATASASDMPPGLDGALLAIFEDLGEDEGMSLDEPLAPAAALIRRLEPELMANVFRWTGHFPERTRVLLRYLAERAAQLHQGYASSRETSATVALTTLVTGLAMNYVQRGSYLP